MTTTLLFSLRLREEDAQVRVVPAFARVVFSTTITFDIVAFAIRERAYSTSDSLNGGCAR